MSGEGSLFDVPPAAFGRFRVLHQIGAGSTGPVFRGQDPATGALVAIKAFRVNLPPERAHEVSGQLIELSSRAPRHPALATPIAAGLSGIEPYLVTVLITGQSLDAALRDYGPAAIADLLPRLRALAEALDEGAERGLCHGTLHPRDVIVSLEDTVIQGLGVAPILARAGARLPTRRPYTAPEVADGEAPTPAADRFSLAALAFEWITGRRPAGPSDAGLEVPAIAGIDRVALAAALSSALASDPADRFQSAAALVDALSDAVQGAGRDPLARERKAGRRSTIVAPALPPDHLDATPIDADALAEDKGAADAPRFDTLTDEEPLAGDAGGNDEAESIAAAPAEPAEAAEPARALRLIEPMALERTLEPSATSGEQPSVAWQGSLTTSEPPRRGFGAGALVAALLIGILSGFVGGSMWAGRAVPPTQAAVATPAPPAPTPITEQPIKTEPPKAETAPQTATKSASSTVAPAPSTAPRGAQPAPRTAPPAPVAGSLLIRSVPSGAMVSVDGVKKGVTPLTVRALAMGTRRIRVERTDYATAERTVALTTDRPSRSIDVRLTATPARAAIVPMPPPAPEKPTFGSLVVESRPPGAQVMLNGRARGTTPLTLDTLAPGNYNVTLQMAGYESFQTTVTVTAGARARAAGSLEQRQEQE